MHNVGSRDRDDFLNRPSERHGQTPASKIRHFFERFQLPRGPLASKDSG